MQILSINDNENDLIFCHLTRNYKEEDRRYSSFQGFKNNQ